MKVPKELDFLQKRTLMYKKFNLIAGILLTVPCGFYATQENAQQEQIPTKLEHCPRGEVDPKLQALLSQVANIFLNFVGVVQNPDDAGEHLTNMMTGAVQMIAQAVKSGQLSLDATQEEIGAFVSHMSRSMTLQDIETIGA